MCKSSDSDEKWKRKDEIDFATQGEGKVFRLKREAGKMQTVLRLIGHATFAVACAFFLFLFSLLMAVAVASMFRQKRSVEPLLAPNY